MILRTKHLLLFLPSIFLLPLIPAHRPDTVPDTELRPLFTNDVTSTQIPTASIQYPIVLPRLPYTNEYEILPDDSEEYEYEEYVYHRFHTVPFLTEMYSTMEAPAVTDEGTIVVYTVPDELDAQQEKLENSATKNCIRRWKLVVAVAALLYVISTFMLS